MTWTPYVTFSLKLRAMLYAARNGILTIRVGGRNRTQSCEAVFPARYQINRPASE